MLTGLLMILAPIIVFILTLPYSGRLKPTLRVVYRFAGGIIVFLGSGISIYLASYTGDQGGIAAYFFQILVILVYAALSIVLVTLNWFFGAKSPGQSEN
jgi:hypothetical protein